MNKKLLISAFALGAFLSCQNQSEAPSAPQGETGALALRVVSTKALAQVESVSVRLSWGADIAIDRKTAWSSSSIKLDGLPLGVRIAVHMEGWNDERGRKLVLWSGDTAVQLGDDTKWEIEKAGAPILIRAADSSSIAAPNLTRLLPVGYAVTHDTLKRVLAGGGSDTITLDTAGIDSIYVDDKAFAGNRIVVASGQVKNVLVVGRNGMSSAFRVYAYTLLPASTNLVQTSTAGASWNKDTLLISLAADSSATLRIDTNGVDTLRKGGVAVSPTDDSYRIVVSKTETFDVVAKGAAGQTTKVVVKVLVAEKPVAKAGLGASLHSLPAWIGATCSLRVSRDSGQVDSVVLVGAGRTAFSPSSDSSTWKLDWTTSGVSATLVIRVYGIGSDGRDSIDIRTTALLFDRAGPVIQIAGLGASGIVVGRSGGTVAWKASDDRGVASSWATEAGGASVVCPSDDSCQASGVVKTFVVHAKDKLGNQTDSTVKIVMDSVAPRIESVLDKNTDKPLKTGDTLWVVKDSAGSVLVAASDSLSGFQVTATMSGATEKIAQNKALSGLGVGSWTLGARDNMGNAMVWGTIVVTERVTVVESKPGLRVHLGALPAWVAKSCSVKVLRDSGTIDTVVATGVVFRSSEDRSIWSGAWSPSRNEGSDTLKIMVRGQGSNGADSIPLNALVSVDRQGPSIELRSTTRGGVLWVGKNGGELAASVQDNRGVDSVWLSPSGKIAKSTSDGLYRATVTGSVTVNAQDGLGNIYALPVSVVRDSLAPSVSGMKDGLNRTLSPTSNIIYRDTTTGVAKLVVNAADSSGFLVRLTNGSSQTRFAAGVKGVAVIDSLVVGVYKVDVEDSLGNTVTWGDVVVRIRPPALNRSSGTYGAEDTKYRDFGLGFVDALNVEATCPDGGSASERTHGDTSSLAWTKVWEYAFNSSSFDFRCVKTTGGPTDTSEVVSRTYNVLQRPGIVVPDSTYEQDSLSVGINLDPATYAHNPTGAQIQYALGTDSSKVTWLPYTVPVVIKGTQVLWARVAYDGKVSNMVKRTYKKIDGIVNWTRNFGLVTAPTARDTAALRNYQIIAWSGEVFDTIAGEANQSSSQGVLRLDAKWQTVGRPTSKWGAFGVNFFLDSNYSTYDFSEAEAIEVSYVASGTMRALLVYPVDPDGSGADGVALRYEDAGAGIPPSTLRNVRINLSTDLKYPSWATPAQQTKTWDDIKGAIRSLRIAVEPTSGSTGTPSGASTTIRISKVAIVGTIRKLP